MVTSNEQQKNFLLELDDDEDTTSRIDNGHQFLNFSRKITEASSMRKPVDIQLGIACGKDLMFNSPSRILRRQPISYNNKASLPPTSPPPLVRRKSSGKKKKKAEEENNLSKNSSNNTTVKISLPLSSLQSVSKKPTTTYTSAHKKAQSPRQEHLPISKNTNKNDTIVSFSLDTKAPTNTASRLLSLQVTSPTSILEQQEKPSTTSTSSHLLDQLVADVLSHIESCPDHSAYSDDLDRLKPKLKAYTITRHSITL